MIFDTYKIIIYNIFFFGFFILFYFLMNTLNRESKKSSLAKYLYTFSYWSIFAGFLLLFIVGLLIRLATHWLQMTAHLGMNMKIAGLPVIASHEISNAHLISVIIWATALLAMSFFIPPIRRLLAHFLPIDPRNRIHTVTLALSTIIPCQLLVTYVIGLQRLNQETEKTGLTDTLASIWSQDIMLALLAMIGVGWLTTRNGREVFERLGLKQISVKEMLLAVIIALVFVAFGYLVDMLSVRFQIGVDPSVESYTEKLLGPLFTSWIGILTLGLAAALGEETIFRGTLVPRFGIILTSLLFAFVHSNYGFSLSTLLVFILGLALGWLRMRYSTTFTMVVHAVYNITLGVMVYYEI